MTAVAAEKVRKGGQVVTIPVTRDWTSDYVVSRDHHATALYGDRDPLLLIQTIQKNEHTTGRRIRRDFSAEAFLERLP